MATKSEAPARHRDLDLVRQEAAERRDTDGLVSITILEQLIHELHLVPAELQPLSTLGQISEGSWPPL